jgi:aminoglycoside 2''-phosphotransferase
LEIEAYLALIDEHFPGLLPHDRQRIAVNADGWSSLILDIEDAYIFRFPRRPEIKIGYLKEAALLPELAQALSISIPTFEFLCLDAADYQRCFVGYRKIRGDPWSADLAETPQIIQQLANFLSELHCFPAERAARLLGVRADSHQWRQKYLEFYDRIQTNAFPLLDIPACRVATQVWRAFLQDEANFSFLPSLIHADLCADHILCDLERQQVSGIIDWEDATLGDPALDFVGLAYIAGWEPVERILNPYRGIVEDTFRRRIAFYLQAVPFHQILFGLQTNDQNHIQEGIHTLSRLQDYQNVSPC